MEKLYELKEKMREELDKIAGKPDMSAGDLEMAHKLTDTIKNIDKICMLEEDEYSEDDGMSYGRGSSYANRGKHYVRGHYSRAGGGSYDGGSGNYSSRRGGGSNRGGSRGGYSRNGGYSRDGGREEMMEHVRMAIDAAPEEYKEDIRRFMREIEE